MGLSPWERVKVHRDDGRQRAEDEVGGGEDGTGATAVGDLSSDAIVLHLSDFLTLTRYFFAFTNCGTPTPALRATYINEIQIEDGVGLAKRR